MSYLVLARKYRPQTFSEIVGQEHISRALANAIIRDKIPHAILLTGPRGVGKTSSARIFAKALNCSNRLEYQELAKLSEEEARLKVEPCGECQNCKDIARSSSLAVWEIDGASHNSVDNVRELIDSLRTVPPPAARFKIYIIDEVHMLSTAAFNALLKSLEEPPPQTVFIFATTDPQKIPETVLSRCQRYDCRRLRYLDVLAQLKTIAEQENIPVGADVLAFLARKSMGGMRDAQSMLDRVAGYGLEQITVAHAEEVFGTVDHEFFFKLASSIFSSETAECLKLIDQVFQRSIDIRQFANDFLSFWRVLYLAKSLEQTKNKKPVEENFLELTAEEQNRVFELISELQAFNLLRLFEMAQKIADDALRSAYPRSVFEAGIAKMSLLPSLQPVAELLSGTQKKRAEISPSVERPVVATINPSPVNSTPSNSTPSNLSPFNPSWSDFVFYVKKERSEHVLAALLRRVGVKKFEDGLLEVEAGAFDIDFLNKEDVKKSLERSLSGYSGIAHWKLAFSEHTKQSRIGETPTGSIVKIEEESEKQKQQRFETEARAHPLVQAVLKTFEGSAIDRVTISRADFINSEPAANKFKGT